MIRLGLMVVIAVPGVAAEPTLTLTLGGTTHTVGVQSWVEDVPHAKLWQTALAVLWTDADVNGDGTLDQSEAKRLPSALRIRQLGWGYLWTAPQPARWTELDMQPSDGRVSREEVADYYRRNAVDGPQFTVGTASPPTALTDALVKHLDTNRDGRVSEAEWTDAPKLLVLDVNGDDIVQADELAPRSRYPGSMGGHRLAADTPAKGIFSVGAAKATIEVASHFGKAPRASVKRGDAPTLTVFAFVVDSPVPTDMETQRTTAVARFTAADSNKDGNLSHDEIAASGYAPLRDHAATADRDGNGTLSADEWTNYLAMRQSLVASTLQVTMHDHDVGLFEFLDADHDGGLSVRELRTAKERLKAAKIISTDGTALSKLPRSVRITLSRGRPSTLLGTPIRNGPAWFLAMDRNRDGDLLRKEFLGTDADFRKLDTDHDSLISSTEATAAKR